MEAVKALLDFIGGRPLVGYYLEYDVGVLANKYVKGTAEYRPAATAGLEPVLRLEAQAKPGCLRRPALAADAERSWKSPPWRATMR